MRLGGGKEETVFNFQETSSSIEIIDDQTVQLFTSVYLWIFESIYAQRNKQFFMKISGVYQFFFMIIYSPDI